MMNKKSHISSVQLLDIKGPWPTKSQGILEVLSVFNHSQLGDFFRYDPVELSQIKNDIRGMRLYRVSNLKKDAKGANEWHRIRKELVIVIKGSVLWTTLDSRGKKTEIILTPQNTALIIPPFTMHSYTVLEDNSEILVLTNTTFDPEDTSTHDTYPANTFPPI